MGGGDGGGWEGDGGGWEGDGGGWEGDGGGGGWIAEGNHLDSNISAVPSEYDMK